MAALYTTDNEVFTCFSFYAALLAAKMLIMSFLTARQRFRKHVISFDVHIELYLLYLSHG